MKGNPRLQKRRGPYAYSGHGVKTSNNIFTIRKIKINTFLNLMSITSFLLINFKKDRQ